MPRKQSTKTLLKKFLALGVTLLNANHIALAIVVKDKKKTFAFGATSTKEYLERKLENDAELRNAIEKDQSDLNLATNYDYYPVAPGVAYKSIVATEEPDLLAYPLEYMDFQDLYKWLAKEIWRDAARRGHETKSGQVKYRDPNYKTSWWPEHIWKWSETMSFSKVNRKYWKKLKLNYDFVTFMKKCVRLCLEHHEIDPKEHVADYDREVLNRRQRNAGVPAGPPVSDNSTDLEDDDQNGSNGVNDNDQNDNDNGVGNVTFVIDRNEDDDNDQEDSDDVSSQGGRFVRRPPGMTYSSSSSTSSIRPPESSAPSPQQSTRSPPVSPTTPRSTASLPLPRRLPGMVYSSSSSSSQSQPSSPQQATGNYGRRAAPETFNTAPTHRPRRERRLRTPPSPPVPMVTWSQSRRERDRNI